MYVFYKMDAQNQLKMCVYAIKPMRRSIVKCVYSTRRIAQNTEKPRRPEEARGGQRRPGRQRRKERQTGKRRQQETGKHVIYHAFPH